LFALLRISIVKVAGRACRLGGVPSRSAASPFRVTRGGREKGAPPFGRAKKSFALAARAALGEHAAQADDQKEYTPARKECGSANVRCSQARTLEEKEPVWR